MHEQKFEQDVRMSEDIDKTTLEECITCVKPVRTLLLFYRQFPENTESSKEAVCLQNVKVT